MQGTAATLPAYTGLKKALPLKGHRLVYRALPTWAGGTFYSEQPRRDSPLLTQARTITCSLIVVHRPF